jgi:hypothetical protein
MIGLSGKCPGKKLSLIVTFFIPTADSPGVSSITRSTKRKGNLHAIQQCYNSILTIWVEKRWAEEIPMWKNITNLIDVKNCRKSWITYTIIKRNQKLSSAALCVHQLSLVAEDFVCIVKTV